MVGVVSVKMPLLGACGIVKCCYLLFNLTVHVCVFVCVCPSEALPEQSQESCWAFVICRWVMLFGGS